MERREFLRTAALAGAATALAGRIPMLTRSALADDAETVATKCLWGIHAEPRARDGTLYTAIAALEKKVGRRFAVDRQYQRWDDPLPSKYAMWTRASGRIPYVSWNSYHRNGTPVSWAQIATGKHDAWIRAQAHSVAGWGRRMYLTFNHEPENDAHHCGTSGAYRAALTHIIEVFRKQGVTNVTWLLTLMSPTFKGNNGGPRNWIPDTPFDVVGVDGYNRWPCYTKSGRKTFYETFAPAHSFAAGIGKPLAIGEYGTVEETACGNSGNPGGKAKWLETASNWIQEWNNVAFVAYSHVFATYRGRPLAFYVDSSSTSLAEFTAIGKLPYFR
jgi:hypothetical protein